MMTFEPYLDSCNEPEVT